MPSIRVGFSSDLNITGGNTGIGTATPTARLEVSGGIVAERIASSGGISTFKEYQGFSQTLATLPHEITTEEGVFSSLTGEIKITGETTVSSASTVEVGKTKTLTVTDRFAVPIGETNNRDAAPEAGTTRFNQDFGTLEFFDGVNWKTVNSYSRGGASGRAVVFGGNTAADASIQTIGYFNIHTLGNAQYFGDALITTRMNAGCSDGVRGVFAGAFPATQDRIEYVTMASEGDSVDFGDLSGDRNDPQMGSASSSTRGIWAGGAQVEDIIDFVEISTIGNAVDFGDLTQGRRNLGGFGSPTRGVFTSGGESPTFRSNNDYITIASKGNAILWREGDIRSGMSGNCASNQIKGFYAGGYTPGGMTNMIDYVTITSLGNGTDFGDLTQARHGSSTASTQTRIIISAGFTDHPASSRTNTVEYITIASSGNSQDFGDYLTACAQAGAISDSHGGLGGF